MNRAPSSLVFGLLAAVALPAAFSMALGTQAIAAPTEGAPKSGPLPGRPGPKPRTSGSPSTPPPAAPACTVTFPESNLTPPTCSGAQATVTTTAGQQKTVTVVQLAEGSTAQFAHNGPHAAAMHTGAEAGFAYEVTLTVGGKKWQAKRDANATTPTAAMLRLLQPSAAVIEAQPQPAHGYAVVPLEPVAGSGAAGALKLRIDF